MAKVYLMISRSSANFRAIKRLYRERRIRSTETATAFQHRQGQPRKHATTVTLQLLPHRYSPIQLVGNRSIININYRFHT